MRFDIYRPIHKAIRLSLSELLVTIGSTDFSDEAASVEALDKLRQQLAFSRSHVAHEDRFIHPALESRVQGACHSLKESHEHHGATFAELEALAAKLEAVTEPNERLGIGHSLYLCFARFVADDLIHMHEEETETLPLLHETFTDAELVEIEGRIVAAHDPDKLIGSLRVMLPALNRVERINFLSGVRGSAPPEAFAAILNFAAKPSLPADDWQHLAEGLQLAA